MIRHAKFQNVVVQPGVSLTWSQTLKFGFLAARPIYREY